MYAKEIEKGVGYLDNKYGRNGWLGKVNTKELDIGSTRTCMLGQLEGNYYNVVESEFGGLFGGISFGPDGEMLFLNIQGGHKTKKWAADHGFNVARLKNTNFSGEQHGMILTQEWVETIDKLRAQETPTEPDVVVPKEPVVSPIQNVEPREVVTVSRRPSQAADLKSNYYSRSMGIWD